MNTLWVLQYKQATGWFISDQHAPFRNRAEARKALKEARKADLFVYRLTKFVICEVVA